MTFQSRTQFRGPDYELSRALSTTLVVLMTAVKGVPTRTGQFGADTVVRHVMGVDRQHRVLAVAEQIEPACASRNTLKQSSLRLTHCDTRQTGRRGYGSRPVELVHGAHGPVHQARPRGRWA